MSAQLVFSNKKLAVGLIAIAIIFVGYLALDMVSGSDVTVSATVSTSVSCNTDITETAFGTLSVSSITTATTDASTTMSCNYAAGCTLTIQDSGSGSNPGLWNSANSYLIASADATLAVGVEGYGIQVSAAPAGYGDTLTLSTTYDKTGNVVGGLLRTATTLASTDSPTSGRTAKVVHKASISGLTTAGTYADTITYGCTGN
ncbi:MAG: hypothetical protein PHN74_00700 [Candidatus Pacebacteria bacterium]|nr:hypothetical protein [Candidatus Paceibacterota bacterium]